MSSANTRAALRAISDDLDHERTVVVMLWNHERLKTGAASTGLCVGILLYVLLFIPFDPLSNLVALPVFAVWIIFVVAWFVVYQERRSEETRSQNWRNVMVLNDKGRLVVAYLRNLTNLVEAGEGESLGPQEQALVMDALDLAEIWARDIESLPDDDPYKMTLEKELSNETPE